MYNNIDIEVEKGAFALFYLTELNFLRLILKKMHIDSRVITEGEKIEKDIDRGLREFLKAEDKCSVLFKKPWDKLEENTVYKITDAFSCCYIFMLLPQMPSKSAFVAGPYVNSEITHSALVEVAEKYSIPSWLFSQLEKYFGNITFVEDERYIMAVCNSLAEVMWGGEEKYTVEKSIGLENKTDATEAVNALKSKSEDPMLSVRALEERYEAENRMMQAVSQGNLHSVEQFFGGISSLVFEQRTDDPLRNMKNYMIIGNTLLRKAAENGSVHPYYIDSVSTDFARKIEQTATVAETSALMRNMVRKYCSLVRTHSMKNYSLFVQKIITTVDSDLTADLSLRNFARMLNVNSSYLSVLFKKETGKTLTEYVAQKRMEHAAYLLRTTKLQVQAVAQQCGIYDVNYFAKMFKKIMGKTPKEYRNDI